MITRKSLLLTCMTLLLGAGVAEAAVIRLQPRQTQACVGQTKKLIQLNTQAEYWRVNGRSSMMSTWQYRGRASTLTLDYATANAVAFCRAPGVDTYELDWRLAFQDPNEYRLSYTVVCQLCPRPLPPVRHNPIVRQLRNELRNARVSLLNNNFGAFGVEIHRALILASEPSSLRNGVLVQVKLRQIEISLERRNRLALLSQLREIELLLE